MIQAGAQIKSYDYFKSYSKDSASISGIAELWAKTWHDVRKRFTPTFAPLNSNEFGFVVEVKYLNKDVS